MGEADHSSLSPAEFGIVWSYTSTPPYVFMVWYLVKHRDNYNFYLHILRNITLFIKVTACIQRVSD
jgi:hypothetical protein